MDLAIFVTITNPILILNMYIIGFELIILAPEEIAGEVSPV